MANPSITNSHAKLYDDCTVADWDAHGGNTGTFASYLNDWIKLNVTVLGGANDYYIHNTVDFHSFIIATYPMIMYRYCTSDLNIKAQIIVYDHAGNPQTILPSSSSTTPVVGAETITLTGHVDKVALYANDAVGTVYYDFILFYAGTFTFPFVSKEVSIDISNNYAHLPIIGKIGSATQWLGAPDTTIHIVGGVDASVGASTRWHDAYSKDLGVLYQVMHQAVDEPWQWFTSDVFSGKVTPASLRVRQAADAEQLLDYDLELAEYRRGSPNLDNYYTRFWGVGP